MIKLPLIIDKSFRQIKDLFKSFIQLQKHGPQSRRISVSSHVCLNCKNEYEGIYCPLCGQKYDENRFTWSNVYQNVFAGLFNVGEGFLRTLIDLLYRPGYMIRDYLGGQRKPYFKPFQLLFVLSALLLICMQFTMPKNTTLLKDFMDSGFKVENTELAHQNEIPEGQKGILDHLFAEYDKLCQFFSDTKLPSPIQNISDVSKDWISGNVASCILMLLPFWYLATKRSFRKTEYGQKMNGPERLLSIVYMGSQLILLLFMMVLYFLIFKTTPVFFWLLMTIYWFMDHYQLYQVPLQRSIKLTIFMTFRILLYLLIFSIIMGFITMQLTSYFSE